MSWLGFVTAALKILDTVGRSLEQRRLISAGEAKEAARALREALNVIDTAKRARDAARGRDADDKRVLDDDGFRRD